MFEKARVKGDEEKTILLLKKTQGHDDDHDRETKGHLQKNKTRKTLSLSLKGYSFVCLSSVWQNAPLSLSLSLSLSLCGLGSFGVCERGGGEDAADHSERRRHAPPHAHRDHQRKPTVTVCLLYEGTKVKLSSSPRVSEGLLNPTRGLSSLHKIHHRACQISLASCVESADPRYVPAQRYYSGTRSNGSLFRNFVTEWLFESEQGF